MGKYLKYLDKLIRAADFSEQASVPLIKVLRREGFTADESVDAAHFMEKSGWLPKDEKSGHVRLTLLDRTVWQRNNILAVHTIVVSETEATPDGKEGVYATIRNDYALDKTGRPFTVKNMVSKCGAFNLRVVRLTRAAYWRAQRTANFQMAPV